MRTIKIVLTVQVHDDLTREDVKERLQYMKEHQYGFNVMINESYLNSHFESAEVKSSTFHLSRVK